MRVNALWAACRPVPGARLSQHICPVAFRQLGSRQNVRSNAEKTVFGGARTAENRRKFVYVDSLKSASLEFLLSRFTVFLVYVVPFTSSQSNTYEVRKMRDRTSKKRCSEVLVQPKTVESSYYVS